jgi:hypothetical protein
LLTTLKHFSCNGPWTGAQRDFAVKAFYKNCDSLVIAQREFRREYRVHRTRAVPSANAIKNRNFIIFENITEYLDKKEHSLVINGLRIPGLLFAEESGCSTFYQLYAAKEN